MKAIIFETFGSSKVLKEAEVSAPQLKAGEVLIKIKYTAVNPVDWKIREGYLQSHLPHRFPIIPGWDLVGEVQEVGAGAEKSWQKGDEVYAYARLPEVHAGTYAEQIAIPASYCAKKPVSLDLATAAAIPLVSLTAYQGLHEVLKVVKGDKILITAAAGGVGAFAVQFAKLAGAQVMAIAGTSNQDYLRELGADFPVNYEKESLGQAMTRYGISVFDGIFDCVGGQTLATAALLAKAPTKVMSIVELPPQPGGLYHFVSPNGDQLKEIAQLFDQRKLLAPPIRVRSIKEAAAAQDENAQRHGRGKIVLKIDF